MAGGTPLHYLVADATGDVATIEYLDGRLVVHRGESLPAAALANDSYARSVSHLRQFSGFGGSRSMPHGSSSLDRFARASIESRTAPQTVDGAFGILASVAQRESTRWSVVYDTVRRELHWVSDGSATRKSVRLPALPFGCTAEAKMLDVHSAMGGDVTSLLEPYDAAVNRALVLSSYATTSFTRNQPQRYAEADAEHAEAFGCGTRRRSVRN